MADRLRVYPIGDLRVQSYLDEHTTRRVFEFMRANGLIGRVRPPRKGALRMMDRMLWRREFEFEGTRYVAEGGGTEIAIFEKVDDQEVAAAEKKYRTCVFCALGHPESDLVESPRGPACRACHAVRYPVCVRCGRKFDFADDEDPPVLPFVCDDCEMDEGA